MLPYQLAHLTYFRPGERDLAGRLIDWSDYAFLTMQELDRLRHVLGSPCILIRGRHGDPVKDTAIDAVFPQASFSSVVMALMRSGYSKGLYQGGSIHLDNLMRSDGLARGWLAFRPSQAGIIEDHDWSGLYDYSADGWDYYRIGPPRSWDLLNYLVDLNEGRAALL